MRTEKEVMETMDMLKPYMNKIMKDIDQGTAISISLAPGIGGWAALAETEKGVEYSHVVRVTPDGDAYDWNVSHQFIDGKYEACSREIDDTYNRMVNA